MATNKLAVLEKKMPLRAYPAEELDRVLETVFKYWLANLLSLKSDQEEKLDFALPYVKQHFWSLGIDQVKKAFEMYATGELRTKPISNYFDVVLVGKIFKEYREIKPRPKTPVVETKPFSERDKEEMLKGGVKRCRNEYEEFGMVLPGNPHIYDYLYENGTLKISNTTKRRLFAEAAVSLKKSDSILSKYVPSEGRQIAEAKRLALEEYFQDLIDEENRKNPPPY